MIAEKLKKNTNTYYSSPKVIKWMIMLVWIACIPYLAVGILLLLFNLEEGTSNSNTVGLVLYMLIFLALWFGTSALIGYGLGRVFEWTLNKVTRNIVQLGQLSGVYVSLFALAIALVFGSPLIIFAIREGVNHWIGISIFTIGIAIFLILFIPIRCKGLAYIREVRGYYISQNLKNRQAKDA